ncbi:MAG: hypothetical protein ACREJO_14915 [Phycisphaerales bacterium]
MMACFFLFVPLLSMIGILLLRRAFPDVISVEPGVCANCFYDMRPLPEARLCAECGLPLVAPSIPFSPWPWWAVVAAPLIGLSFSVVGLTALHQQSLFLLLALWYWGSLYGVLVALPRAMPEWMFWSLVSLLAAIGGVWQGIEWLAASQDPNPVYGGGLQGLNAVVFGVICHVFLFGACMLFGIIEWRTQTRRQP